MASEVFKSVPQTVTMTFAFSSVSFFVYDHSKSSKINLRIYSTRTYEDFQSRWAEWNENLNQFDFSDREAARI